MAGSVMRKDPSLIAQLRREPYRFEFFRAARVAELSGDALAPGASHRVMPGMTDLRDAELLRFRGQPSTSFPYAAVSAIRSQVASAHSSLRPELLVAALGLYGALGTLPLHYTEVIISRLREKDTSLRAWLDQFNHRLISYYYRAWEKHRLLPGYDRAVTVGQCGADTGSSMTRALGGARYELKEADERWLARAMGYYAGLFGNVRRNAASLAYVLRDYFGMPVEVCQFMGQWLEIPETELTRMGALGSGPKSCTLGVDSVVGDRVFDVSAAFLIRIGPLHYPEFRRLIPEEGDVLPALCRLARAFAGDECDFAVQALLLPAEVPACGMDASGVRLGRNGWLATQQGRVHPVAVMVKQLGQAVPVTTEG